MSQDIPAPTGRPPLPDEPPLARRLRAVAVGLLLANVAFFCFSTYTRVRHYDDPDAMNFVDVARNVAAGRGVGQSTLGFNQPVYRIGDPIPAPLTSQSPVWPAVVAGLARAGVEPLDGSLVLSLGCFVLIVALAFALARRLADGAVALLAAAFVAAYLPLRFWSQSAMSDPLGVAAVMAALVALLRAQARPSARLWLLAGLLAGAATAVRFALVPVAGLALLCAALTGRDRRWGYTLACAVGLAAASLPVIVRGALAGGAGYLGSETGVLTNVQDVVLALAGDYADVPDASRTLRPWLLAVVSVAVAAMAVRHGRLTSALSSAFAQRGAWLLTVWAVAYVLFLVAFRSVHHVDRLTTRLLLPAAVVLIPQAVVWFSRAAGLRGPVVVLGAALLSAGSLGAQVSAHAAASPFRVDRLIESSPRLSWISASTSPADLIIGDDVVDVPFLLKRTWAVSFSGYPYSPHVDEATLMNLCRTYRRSDGRAFLVLRNRLPSERVWLYAFGPFITDLAFGRTAAYPALVEVTRLSDGTVFEVRCDAP